MKFLMAMVCTILLIIWLARLKEYFSQFGEIVNVAMILNSGNVQKLKEEYKRARLKRIKAETHAHATKGYSCCCVPFVHSLQQRM